MTDAAKQTAVLPLNHADTVFVLPSAPVDGKAGFALKQRLLQGFPDGRAPYVKADGPLETPCWLWLGATHAKGYAVRWIDNRRVTVHRALVGPLADGEDAHHLCQVRRCVNPEHIQRISKADHARLHRGGDTALDVALVLLARHPRLSPAAIAGFSGHTRSAVHAALRRAEHRGLVRRVTVGEYVLADNMAELERLIVAQARDMRDGHRVSRPGVSSLDAMHSYGEGPEPLVVTWPHHGTETGYQRGCRLPCCRDAHAHYRRERRARGVEAS